MCVSCSQFWSCLWLLLSWEVWLILLVFGCIGEIFYVVLYVSCIQFAISPPFIDFVRSSKCVSVNVSTDELTIASFATSRVFLFSFRCVLVWLATFDFTNVSNDSRKLSSRSNNRRIAWILSTVIKSRGKNYATLYPLYLFLFTKRDVWTDWSESKFSSAHVLNDRLFANNELSTKMHFQITSVEWRDFPLTIYLAIITYFTML